MIPEIIDQFLHSLWAFAAIAPVLIKRRVWTASLSALILCLPRELVDQWHGWPIGDGKLLDIAFFVIGGTIAGIILIKKKREVLNENFYNSTTNTNGRIRS